MGTCNEESSRTWQVIDKSSREDHIWRRKMEGNEGLNLNTVECLRGRLIAERNASKVAKEEAESLAIKLVELERMLKEEIKLREKAEKRLKFLRKKLESFNKSRKSEHSDSSEITENSFGSSSISSIFKHYSEANETKHHAKNEEEYHNVVVEEEAFSLIQSHNSSSTTKDSDSHVTDNSSCNSGSFCSLSKILMKDPYQRSENLKNDESSLSSLSSKSSETNNEDNDKGNFFDNSLALVPVNVMIATSHTTKNSKPVSESAIDVLNKLKHARERIQSSMETMQMIQVGPI